MDATDPGSWGPAIDEAVNTVSRGGLVVLPTDTVYGIGADAFTPPAVAALLAAKGRGRQTPPPVLVPDARTIEGLCADVPPVGFERRPGASLTRRSHRDGDRTPQARRLRHEDEILQARRLRHEDEISQARCLRHER